MDILMDSIQATPEKSGYSYDKEITEDNY